MNQRTEEMRKLYDEGYSYEDIGRKFNISHSRVHQILTGYKSFAANDFDLKRFPNLITTNCGTKDCPNKPSDVHHKDGNSANNDLANLIYLCKPCHGKVHRGKPHTKRKKVEVVDTPISIYLRSVGKIGGKSTLKKYGKEHYRKIGKIGGSKKKGGKT